MRRNCFSCVLVTLAAWLFIISCQPEKQKHAVVIQTDFGLKDGAVAEMKGVMNQVDPSIRIFDLTHEIPAYNIWEAAYRLNQTAPYWPTGTVFVNVVDPGVGTERKSIVLKTRSGHYFVSPDNGSLTLVSQSLGIAEVREIDEQLNRRKGSAGSYTFHGRDVYAYTGARLAAGVISFEEVGGKLSNSVLSIPFQTALIQGDSILGNIPILDIQYGNVWTNIPEDLVKQLKWNYGDSLSITIKNEESIIYQGILPFSETFGKVEVGKPLAYINSLMNLSLAINQGSFADIYKIGSGPGWSVFIHLMN